jgi:group I intron endonuclease
MTCCIYTIATDDGRVYVGSTVDYAQRRATHLRDLRIGKHHAPLLQRAFNADRTIRFAVVERVEDANFLMAREQFWIWRLAPALNVKISVVGKSGYRHSIATRAKMRDAHIGLQVSDACRRAAIAAIKGKPRSDAHRERLSASLVGRSSPNEGQQLSATTKARISDRLKAAWGGAGRAAMLAALEKNRAQRGPTKPPPRGWTHSEETRQRMSKARRLYWRERKARI